MNEKEILETINLKHEITIEKINIEHEINIKKINDEFKFSMLRLFTISVVTHLLILNLWR